MNGLLNSVDASDRRVSDLVRSWLPPRWFCVGMVAATRFGDGPGWAAVGLGLLAAGPRGRAAAATATVAALLASLVFMALKRRFRRARPCDAAPHPHFHVRPPDAFSFPSGHTMNAFAIATVLALFFPSLAPPWPCSRSPSAPRAWCSACTSRATSGRVRRWGRSSARARTRGSVDGGAMRGFADRGPFRVPPSPPPDKAEDEDRDSRGWLGWDSDEDDEPDDDDDD